MVKDIFRDSTIGQFLNSLSGGRLLPYEDQRPGYAIPSHFLPPTASRPVSVALSVVSKTRDDVKKEEALPADVPASNKRASTFTVIALDARPPSRISDGGRLSPYTERRSSVYTIPSQFVVPASESEIAFAPIGEPAALEDGSKKINESVESLAVEVKRDSVALALVKEVEDGGRTSPSQIMGFHPDLNLVGWDGKDDPDNPRFVFRFLRVNIR